MTYTFLTSLYYSFFRVVSEIGISNKRWVIDAADAMNDKWSEYLIIDRVTFGELSDLQETYK